MKRRKRVNYVRLLDHEVLGQVVVMKDGDADNPLTIIFRCDHPKVPSTVTQQYGFYHVELRDRAFENDAEILQVVEGLNEWVNSTIDDTLNELRVNRRLANVDRPKGFSDSFSLN